MKTAAQAFLSNHEVASANNLTTTQAALYLSEVKGIPTSPKSLEVYRCQGKGPKFKKIISRVFYDIEWLDEYAQGIPVKIYDPAKMGVAA